MKKILFGLFFFLLNLVVSGQNLLFPYEQKKDLEFLDKKLRRLHPGLFYYQTNDSYIRLKDSIELTLNKPCTEFELYRKFALIIRNIEDLHTSISPSKVSKNEYSNSKFFPFYIRQFEDKYFVSYNLSSDSSFTRNSEIIGVNGITIKSYISEMENFFGTDNNNQLSKKYYAEKYFSKYLYRIIGSHDSLKIEYRHRQSDPISSKFVRFQKDSDLNKMAKMRYKTKIRRNFEYKILDSARRTATLTITSFSSKSKIGDVFFSGFRKKARLRFKEISKDSIQNLIIDLRGNGGGYIPNAKNFLKYFAPYKGPMIDSMFFKKSAYFRVNPPYLIIPPIIDLFLVRRKNEYFYYRSKLTRKNSLTKKYFYDKNLFFLANSGSYSATILDLAKVRDNKIGTIVGERAGGANWGSFAGSWANIKLPNSKIRVHIPLYKLQHYLPNKINKGFFIEPDVAVKQNFEEFTEWKDSEIEKVKTLIK